jgi:hypothetical protein
LQGQTVSRIGAPTIKVPALSLHNGPHWNFPPDLRRAPESLVAQWFSAN